MNQELEEMNKQMADDLGEWQAIRRKTKGGYKSRYELGAAIHIKDHQFVGIW
jgi:hypothetical protein